MVLPDLVPICREQHFRRRFIPVIGAATTELVFFFGVLQITATAHASPAVRTVPCV